MTTGSTMDNVVTWFSRCAVATPTAIAVVDDHGTTTYSALAARADAVCRWLADAGLRPEQPVGVLMQRRAELLAVLLGIMKAGCAYVPFDPQDPTDRVRRMLRSGGCDLVLGDGPLLANLREARDAPAPRCIDVGSIPARAAGQPPLPVAPGGERLAYLLFTSGSTGDPKAVEVEHRHVLSLLRSARELLRFDARDRCLAASTIAFDASITELFLPLVTGASLLLRDRTILLDPRRLARDVREHAVSIVQTGPSVWAVALAEVPDFPRVRIAITHGEAVGPDLARRLCAYGDEVWNLYGPTETTVWATGCRLTADTSSLSAASAPIGRPLPHVCAFVVDEHGTPLPDGREGELWLGGPSVARGYRGKDELTQERFVAFRGERVYRSGDVVVRDPDGVLHYFGRNDDQIKVRGVRVEPGEVESALRRDPRVAQAAVTWFPTPSGPRAIVAAVVLQPGATCRAQDLHRGLESLLPSTMIPARFLFVPRLPSTTSGKVDRKAIRQAATNVVDEPAAADPARATAPPSTRPLTNTERAVADIWRRMLHVDAVAPDDHFFSIGGDSLTAVQMMVEVEGLFGMTLPVHLAFEAPTLEQLCRRIERAKRPDDDADAPSQFVYPLVPEGSGPPVFFSNVDLVLARRGLWTLPCPLFAISNWAKGSGFVRARSLQDLAKEHLVSIRRIQPTGPYRLAGFSLGGLIAYEMAQQLRAAGERVETLFLVDPMMPRQVDLPGFRMPADDEPPLRARIARRVRRLAKGPGAEGWAHWFSLWLPERLAVTGWFRYVTVNHYLRHPNAASRLLFPRNRWSAFWFAAQRMMKGYVARPFDGPTVVTFCHDGPGVAVWKALLGPQVVTHRLDSPHLTLFEPPALGTWLGWMTEAIRSARRP